MLNTITGYCQTSLAEFPAKVAYMEPFKTRMRRIRERAGFASQEDAAAAIGCKRGNVGMWEAPSSSVKRLGEKWLFRVARVYKVRPEWINDLTSKDDGYPWSPDQDLSTGSSPETASSVHNPESGREMTPGYVRFPLLDGFVAAGEGGYVADYPEVVREIDVAEDWVRRNIAAPVNRVRVITAQGDSMQPEIGSGDVLFVDSGVTRFDNNAVYVMNWQGRPIVKRLQVLRDGRVLIKSVNPAYEVEEVPPGEVDQLHISGRVVGVWQFRKY